MKREEKVNVVQEYVGIFESPGVYLMDFTGINVAEITGLRRKLRDGNVSMRVVKNTLAKRALGKIGNDGLDSFFVGPVGVVYSADDTVTPAKLLLDFLKEAQKGEVKAGLVDGVVVDVKEVEAISKLPTKKELHGLVASALNAPIVKMARSLNALPIKLAQTLQALADKNADE